MVEEVKKHHQDQRPEDGSDDQPPLSGATAAGTALGSVVGILVQNAFTLLFRRYYILIEKVFGFPVSLAYFRLSCKEFLEGGCKVSVNVTLVSALTNGRKLGILKTEGRCIWQLALVGRIYVDRSGVSRAVNTF